MDRNLITLYELQLYVKSWGNSKNDRVKIFLENVFQIGLSKIYDDVFPMKEFEYGDLLVLDQEFIYNEYLNFLEKNEIYDDVLFNIAENEYPNFYREIKYAFKPLEDILSHFKTRKKLIEEEIERRKQEKIRQMKKLDEDLKLLKEEYEKIKKEEKTKSTPHSNDKSKINEEVSMRIDYDYFFTDKDIYSPSETFLEKIRRQMGVNINNDLQANLYARIRIEEHLKDVLTVKEDIGKVFSE